MPSKPSLIYFICLVSLIGCQSKANKELSPAEQSTPETSQPNMTRSPEPGPLKLKGIPIGLGQPHLYEVRLQWEILNREPSTFFIIKRSDWHAGRVVQGEQGFYQDSEVEEGKEYSYFVQMINGSKGTASDWIQIQVPKDQVFEAGEHIQTGKLTDYARLFFKSGSRIFWQGDKLEIKAQEIISEGVILESFTLDQKTAATGSPGKSGGSLIIRAGKLTGPLYIRADGQNGGTGVEGSKGATGEKGATGPKTFLQWGTSNRPPGAYRVRGYWFYCDPPRPPGTDGAPGGVGSVGLPGGPGGNTSKVLVEVADTGAGEVFFTNKPGLGGEGGLGGAGGDGGEGGWSGEIDWQSYAPSMPQEGADLALFHQCNAKQGATGPSGPRGPMGPRAEDGFHAPFCLKLGSSQMGTCP